MKRVLISDKLSEDAVEVLKTRGIEVTFEPGLGKDPEKLKAALPGHHGIAIRSATKMTAEMIEAGTDLKVIGRAGIGVDNVDIDAATATGIAVMNTPFGNATTTAEHAIAMMLSLARQIPQANESTHQGKWEKSRFMGREITGKTLGLIGCGNIGSIVADRAQGLHMKVVAFDPFLTEARAIDLGVERVELDDLLKRADFITLHTPLTDQTRNILSKQALAKTKKGVRIINCARGGLVDEEALYDGLESGHIAGAALDVFEKEPATEHKLFGRDDVICTPHLGAATTEAQENVAIQIAEQIADYLLTGAVTNALNMPSVSAEEAPKLRPYIDLAGRLGGLAGQLAPGAVTGVEMAFAGTAASLNPAPMTAAALTAVLRPAMREAVNSVNAGQLAKQRGIQVSETRTETSPNFGSTVSVKLTTDKGELSVTGALFGGEPRAVRIGNVRLESNFAPHMLYVQNKDKPGFIGNLGKLLSSKDINIATFNLGRAAPGGTAYALLAVDQPLDDDTLKALSDLPQIDEARMLSF
ncbi:putative phosphoglycerate dehydrogenase [Parvularcula bermudensis HTCC2503]|uniref:D-3-phosphoglycerate dehydrogenase n=1 Tax=Parvularcula bermudensis (strain ATCC BAA-594 / HTCC2503 / KCTC 12087) TaxID=314260 RepID=E0TBV1_PARBH|nr:phosphoglycerate dehydrogenase [Parvularcula bermudensis]ADM08444.1 putative phosphoglycerate dehydrogenase [Parvularcula bermudensis HTCC2503]